VCRSTSSNTRANSRTRGRRPPQRFGFTIRLAGRGNASRGKPWKHMAGRWLRPRWDMPRRRKGRPALRFNWETPYVVSPHSPSRLYYGANILFRSDDRGNTWKAVSKNLTPRVAAPRIRTPVLAPLRHRKRGSCLFLLHPVASVERRASTRLAGGTREAVSESVSTHPRVVPWPA